MEVLTMLEKKKLFFVLVALLGINIFVQSQQLDYTVEAISWADGIKIEQIIDDLCAAHCDQYRQKPDQYQRVILLDADYCTVFERTKNELAKEFAMFVEKQKDNKGIMCLCKTSSAKTCGFLFCDLDIHKKIAYHSYRLTFTQEYSVSEIEKIRSLMLQFVEKCCQQKGIKKLAIRVSNLTPEKSVVDTTNQELFYYQQGYRRLSLYNQMLTMFSDVMLLDTDRTTFWMRKNL